MKFFILGCTTPTVSTSSSVAVWIVLLSRFIVMIVLIVVAMPVLVLRVMVDLVQQYAVLVLELMLVLMIKQ